VRKSEVCHPGLETGHHLHTSTSSFSSCHCFCPTFACLEQKRLGGLQPGSSLRPKGTGSWAVSWGWARGPLEVPPPQTSPPGSPRASLGVGCGDPLRPFPNGLCRAGEGTGGEGSPSARPPVLSALAPTHSPWAPSIRAALLCGGDGQGSWG